MTKIREMSPVLLLSLSMIILFVVGISYVLDKPSKPIKTEQTEISTEDILTGDNVILDSQNRPVKLTGNYWDVTKHNLVYTGIVVGGEEDAGDVYTNWISIRNESGEINIIRNIDKDVWRAIQIGDVIR